MILPGGGGAFFSRNNGGQHQDQKGGPTARILGLYSCKAFLSWENSACQRGKKGKATFKGQTEVLKALSSRRSILLSQKEWKKWKEEKLHMK